MLFPIKLFIPITLFVLALNIGCGQEDMIKENTIEMVTSLDGNIETLIIGPYTETCIGFIEQQCYLEFNEESQA